MFLRVLLPLVILAVTSGCRKPAPVARIPSAPPTLLPGTVVNAPGSWWAPHGGGSFQLEVNQKAGELEYRWHFFDEAPPSSGKSTRSGAAPITFPSWSPDWFIYVEDTGDPTLLWFYGSSRRLWYTTIRGKDYDPPTRVVIDQNGKRAEESRQPPAEVIQRLPSDLRMLFPLDATPTERPTF